MDDIRIIQNGKVISRIISGETAAGTASILAGENAVYMVYDRNVAGFAGQIEAAALAAADNAAGCTATKAVFKKMAIDATETSKNIGTVMEICSWLLEEGAGRDALVLGVGGGITSDMAGFAAGIYKRGIRFAFVPTTLLAQVDAAIGGKTGVNVDSYKNMVGLIRQPEWTYECPEALATLPYRDFVSGSAEMIKTFIIDNSGDNYARAAGILCRINSAESRRTAIESYCGELMGLVHAAAAVKAGIVGRDQFEGGERRMLNLGHTFAHAIEKLSNSRRCAPAESDMTDTKARAGDITHGEAVSIGMVMAAELSERLGTAEEPVAAKLRNRLASCGLPTECPFALEELEEAMTKDKKAEGGVIHFILIRSIGETVIHDMTAKEAIDLLKK